MAGQLFEHHLGHVRRTVVAGEDGYYSVPVPSHGLILHCSPHSANRKVI